MDFTIVIPFFNGLVSDLDNLLDTIPETIPVIIVDDLSDVQLEPLQLNRQKNVQVLRIDKKGYFAGACNFGIRHCSNDVLLLNHDSIFTSNAWLDYLEQNKSYAMVGDKISGVHPAWPNSYIQGEFMFLRRDALNKVGLLNDALYPIWGSSCEMQLRLCRQGFPVLPTETVPGYKHLRPPESRWGNSIQTTLNREPEKRKNFIQTPPLISLIVPCYNQGRYIKDLVNSLIGGNTSIGSMNGQTLQSFEIVIVDDCSTDDSADLISEVVDPWKAIRAIKLSVNRGKPSALNAGIKNSYGRYITILDADDMREERSLELLYEALVRNPHSFSYDDARIFSDGFRRQEWKMGEYIFPEVVRKNPVHTGVMFPREAWNDTGGYPENMRSGREDWAFNIALGLAGWCGFHVHYSGYLYRREGQNRTLKNTGPDWDEFFKGQIRDNYPRAFIPEVQMGCCGGRRVQNQAPVRQTVMAAKEEFLPGAQGFTVVEYTGGNFGTMTVYGAVTGTRYQYSASKRKIQVDSRDLRTDQKHGILDLEVNGQLQFKVSSVVQNVHPKEPVVEVVSEPITQKKVDEIVVASVEKPAPSISLNDITTSELPGIGKTLANRLEKAGITNAQQVVNAETSKLCETLGWTESRVESFKDVVRGLLNVD